MKLATFAAALLLVAACAQVPPPRQMEEVTIREGDLTVTFRDNSRSPKPMLSGVQSLFHKAAPDFDAFDPDSPGSSAGLNFEHIISDHSDPHNAFSPRRGRYTLHAHHDGRTVELRRAKKDSPWSVSSTMKYAVKAPHYIDMEFRCVPHDRGRFGERGWALFFWANYMNDVEEVGLNFLGVSHEGGRPEWIVADGPQAHAHWNRGGTYRGVGAPDLEYDENHNFNLNNWSYPFPKFSKPFYYGRAANGMVYILMFKTLVPGEDQARFSIFKFKLPRKPRPAWDFQYVINRVEEGKEYGFLARAVWKKFVSREDCLREYENWTREVGE